MLSRSTWVHLRQMRRSAMTTKRRKSCTFFMAKRGYSYERVMTY